jgi:uncharacterized protein YkuJ
MKNKFPILFLSQHSDYFRYFFFGFFFIAVIHYSGSCKNDNNPVATNPPPSSVDVTKITDGAKTAENAFITGDKQQVANILTEDSKTLYKDDLDKISSNDLIEIGNAMKTRSLDKYGEQYAEFSFQKDGQTFTVAFARQADDSWKLMRF